MSVPSVAIEKGIDPKTQEEEYVHTIYNEIASHFSQTRYKPWPIVEKFLRSRQDYSVGIDVGCGNGKYLGINKNLFIIGTDRSDGLIYCGRDISDNKYNLGVSDGLNLPHSEDSIDFAISIAVIHHFSTEQRRIEAIGHILSKLRTGGELLVYCWALEQETSRRGYKEGDEQDILIPWVLQEKPIKKEKKPRQKHNKRNSVRQTEEGPIQSIIEENEPVLKSEVKKEPVTKYRYYHLYKKGELGENALKAGGCTIVDEGYERDNWWVIVRKS